MVTRLKNSFRNYFCNVWLIEIVIVLISFIYVGIGIYNQVNKNEESILFSSIEKVFLKDKYYADRLEEEVYNFLESVDEYVYNDMNMDDEYEYYEVNNVTIKNLFYEDLYFIVKNNNTNEIITNDLDFYNEVIDNNIDTIYVTKSTIESYLRDSLNDPLYVCYDDDKINIYNDSNKVDYNIFFTNEDTKNCTEFFYTQGDEYKSETESRVYTLVTVCAVIVSILLIKIIFLLISKKGKLKIRGNIIKDMIYIFKYGFRYFETRKALVSTIIVIIILIIAYFYLLAVARYEDNIIAKFFSRYPIKGSVILIFVPIIFILISIKKSVDICLVNERLKEINKGNLDYELVEQGSPEIRELIKDIKKIKDGYRIALEDVLSNEKIKTELISNVSHDLRTPLTSIINYVNILGSGDLSEEERQECIKILDEKSKKLKILIDDLFEMSKINSGKTIINRERIEIISLAYQVIGEYSYLYDEKNVEFIVESSHEEVYMELDGKMMSRVFENVIINSLKYSLENTRIYIQIEDYDNKVEISFKNIANYKMDFNNNDIFERFVRGDKSRNSKVEGSGLGLAITKSIIEQHEGEVKINREGDMFKLYIILPKL